MCRTPIVNCRKFGFRSQTCRLWVPGILVHSVFGFRFTGSGPACFPSGFHDVMFEPWSLLFSNLSFLHSGLLCWEALRQGVIG